MTRKEFIQHLKDFYKKHGRSPKRKEMPYSIHWFAYSRFGSWNNALKKANLPVNVHKDLSREYIAELAMKFYKKYKRIPYLADMYKVYRIDMKTIKEYFGNKTWFDICMEIFGSSPLRTNKREFYESLTKEEVIKRFIREFKRIKPKNWHDFDRRRDASYVPSINYIRTKFNLKYNDILILYGLKEPPITREIILKRIKEYYKKYGKAPASTELDKLGFKDHHYKKYFGSWINAIKAAGIKPANSSPEEVTETNEELIEMYKAFSMKYGCYEYGATSEMLNNSDEIYNADVFCVRFGGMNELRLHAGFRPIGRIHKRYTIKMLSKIYKDLCEELGHVPPYSEYRKLAKERGLPSPTTYLRYFKTTKISLVRKKILKT